MAKMAVLMGNPVHLVQKANPSKEAGKARQRANPAEVLQRAKERALGAEAAAKVQPKVAERSLNQRISGRREPKRTETLRHFCGTPRMHS